MTKRFGLMTDPRFKGEELITGRIPLGDLVGKGYQGLLYEKETNVKTLVSPRYTMMKIRSLGDNIDAQPHGQSLDVRRSLTTRTASSNGSRILAG